MTNFFEDLFGFGRASLTDVGRQSQRRISYEEEADQRVKMAINRAASERYDLEYKIALKNHLEAATQYKKQEEDKMKEDVLILGPCAIKTIDELQGKIRLIKEELNNLIIKIISIQNQIDMGILIDVKIKQ